METVENRGQSRRQKRKVHGIKEEKSSHFRTVCFGGFEEGQVLCYLWDLVKTLEADQGKKRRSPEAAERTGKQIRLRFRVEMRRYFSRRRRRNVKLITGTLALAAGVAGIFGFVVGIDRVVGNSMYPYLNNGDWVIYSRQLGSEISRNEVIVFDKYGENFVKRVTGLPGDTVEISQSGGRVIVNHEEVQTNYVILTKPGEEEMESRMSQPMTVMEGQYLVLGDNRGVSIDSRDSKIGTVPREDILGKVILIIRTSG